MKKFINIFLVLAALCITAACHKKNVVEEEPYNRSKRVAYERKIRYSSFAPFMYEGKPYAYYSLAKKISGPDKEGYYLGEFKNGSQKGETIKTKDFIVKVIPASESNLRKGGMVMVNHWDPKVHDDDARADIWRKAVVYNIDDIEKGRVMLEFPHDRNDFMAIKETYLLQNIWLIIEPEIRDVRIFLD